MTNKGNKNKFDLLFILTIGLLWLAFTFNACYKTNYYAGSDASLRFSVDTLVFDTVFTTVGSATRILKVFNDLDQPVEISSIYLESGQASKFRLNIDGISDSGAELIEIGARDSIYIFGEVTVDPDEPISVSPFIISDQLVFDLNGKKQSLRLEAWGQNANYMPGKTAKGKAFITSCDMGSINWDDPKPYVIYGTLLVDSCTLIIPEGTQIYFHGGYAQSPSGFDYNDGQLYFLENGSIQVNGSLENPVVFQTDRLEHKYDDISGLWSGIYFLSGSRNNSMNYAILKNANIGLYLDSAVHMDLRNTKILHNITTGIYARHAQLKAVNCLIGDSGGFGITLRYGGDYQMDHVTVANFDNQEEALYLGNYQCRDYLCSNIDINPLNAEFRNCIFFGNGKDELFFEDAYPDQPDAFKLKMDNCLVAVDELLKTARFGNFLVEYPTCLNGAGENPVFIDRDTYNFKLDSNSIVINKGIYLPDVPSDIDSTIRDGFPDLGCYEYK